MTYRTSGVQVSTAAAWLRENPSVADGARERAAVPGKATPDAVLEDPTRLVEIVKEALVEAIRTDAPVGVVEELLPALRVLSAGARGFDRSGYLASQLSALQGLRDRTEIDEALAKSAANAPDEVSRKSIERLRFVADAVSVSDEPFVLEAEGTAGAGTGTVRPESAGGAPSPGAVDGGGLGRVPGGGEPPGGGAGTGTDVGAVSADLGSQLGAQIGGYLGGPAGAEVGAQIGGSFGGGFDGSNGAQFGSSLGAEIGFQLAGQTGADIGAQIGAHIGAQAQGHGVSGLGHMLVDVAGHAACALCGPACIPCMLAAEAVTEWLVQHIDL